MNMEQETIRSIFNGLCFALNHGIVKLRDSFSYELLSLELKPKQVEQWCKDVGDPQKRNRSKIVRLRILERRLPSNRVKRFRRLRSLKLETTPF